jgi:acyl carrier protein|tara:strand:- start:16 stop:249 length:234 start_codon:yes stop_codon:yes gene_type:complete
MKNKEKIIDLLLKTSSKLNKKILIDEKKHLINDGYLDSFDIIILIAGIEKMNKKKINTSLINKNTFGSLSKILKLVK